MKKINYFVFTSFILVLTFVLFSCETLPFLNKLEPKSKDSSIQQMILDGKSAEAKEFFMATIDINAIDENGNTALHAAAQVDDSDLVTFLVFKGADTELKNHDGNTPLHLAIKNDSIKSATILAAVDGNIFARDGNNKTALELGLSKGETYYPVLITTQTGSLRDIDGKTLAHYLVLEKNTKALDYCIQKNLPLSEEDYNGKTPLAYAYLEKTSIESIQIAASLILANVTPLRGNYSYFEDAVKTRNPSLRFNDGQTPLHFAAILGHKGITEYLLEKGASVKAKDILGSTPLHEAARYGNLEIIDLLLTNGADPNSQDSLGKTPLGLIFPQEKRIQIYERLLASGANPNAKDMYGDTPLHIATMNDMDLSILQCLQKGGADINERNKQGITPMALAVDRLLKEHVRFFAEHGADIHAEDIEGKSPLVRILTPSSNKTNLEILKIMINKANILSRDSFGNTALHLAVINSASEDQIKYLLTLTQEVDVRNKNGDTPLFLAVQNNRRTVGEMLIGIGADVFTSNNSNYSPLRLALMTGGEVQEWILTSSVIHSTDGIGNTPLHYAAEWKLDNAVLSLLEKSANPNVQNSNGETPIFNAVKSDSATTIELLCSKNAKKDARDYLGNTPLHSCIRWEAKNAAMMLIKLKADINAQNLAGKTPLAEAARSGRISMVSLLIDNNANIDAYDATGKTVLMDAIQSGSVETVSLLIRRGASPLLQEMYGRNAYHEAAESGRLDMITVIQLAGGNPLSRDTHGTTPFSLVLNYPDNIIKAVLGNDTRLMDSDGNTPLHIAIKNHVSAAKLEMILDLNFPVNTRNSDGVTPLLTAVETSQLDLARVLLSHNADPYATDNSGECALSIAIKKETSLLDAIVKNASTKVDISGDGILHYAARIADVETLQKLLSMGLSKTVRNISGETPRDIAIRWQRTDIADLLK